MRGFIFILFAVLMQLFLVRTIQVYENTTEEGIHLAENKNLNVTVQDMIGHEEHVNLTQRRINDSKNSTHIKDDYSGNLETTSERKGIVVEDFEMKHAKQPGLLIEQRNKVHRIEYNNNSTESKNNQQIKENYPMHQAFIPSPEVRKKTSSSQDLNSDSFQPVEHPYNLMQTQLPSPSTVEPIRRTTLNYANDFVSDYQDDIITSNEYNNELDKKKSSENLRTKKKNQQMEVLIPKRQLEDWKVIEEDDEQPESKILNVGNSDKSEEIPASKPVWEEPQSSPDNNHHHHPYPFEIVKEQDNNNKWWDLIGKTVPGNGYNEDQNYEISSPPSKLHHHHHHNDEWESIRPGGPLKEIVKPVKPNPLNSILHILSAIVPIGLLVSALTPNVVVINPNATNTNSRSPSNLNIFGSSRHRSLVNPKINAETNFRDAFDALTLNLMDVQNPKTILNCTKWAICQVLVLQKTVEMGKMEILQKTISGILQRNHVLASEVNALLGELFEAAKKDMCSIMYACEEKHSATKSN